VIDQQVERPWGSAPSAKIPEIVARSPIQRQFVVRKGELFRIQQSTPDAQAGEVPVGIGESQLFNLDLPKEGVARVGESWTTTGQSSQQRTVFTHTLAGFADVGGVATAKIISIGGRTLTGSSVQGLERSVSDRSMQMLREGTRGKDRVPTDEIRNIEYAAKIGCVASDGIGHSQMVC
jgi:hypothetical protein